MLLQKKPLYVPKPRGRATDSATWSPVALQAMAPTKGVELREGGLFHKALVENIDYLLRSFSVDHMLYPFRVRAGETDPPGGDAQVEFWDTRLEGSNAGRFLMGAGNTLRWMAHPELRRRMDAVVEAIEACRRPDGFIHAFAPEGMISGDPGTPWGQAQRSSYVRAWLTHGLIEASLAGNAKALPLVRGGHDWFNRCPYLADLPQVMLWSQGHIASTRMYFTPAGKAEDMQVAERYYLVDEWMDRLAARDLEAIWIDGLGNPHCYEISALEAYLDHHLATGERRCLEAVEGAWEMILRHWMHAGGSVAICEGRDYPPDSRFIDWREHTGEFCGSVFWVKLNQRFHLMRPEDERYAAEIERCIYNVALANQEPGQGIRYHTHLEGHKEKPTQKNTCCEGQGTRLLGSLPEYIYSVAADGLYVNLFESSAIEAEVEGRPVRLAMETDFPRKPGVKLTVARSPGRMKLRVRVPSWAAGPMAVGVNGKRSAEGSPGTYVELARDWRDGDVVEFELPVGLRIARYRGADNFNWHIRFSLHYGPLLLAVVGPPGRSIPQPDPGIPILIRQDPEAFPGWLHRAADDPLRWEVDGHPDYFVIPYWLVSPEQHFSCYPVLAGSP